MSFSKRETNKKGNLKLREACLGLPPLCIHPSQFISCWSMWPPPWLPICSTTWLKKFAKSANSTIFMFVRPQSVDVLAEG